MNELWPSEPPEPTHPTGAGHRYSRRWLWGWSLVAVAGVAAFVAALVADRSAEQLAILGAVVAVAMTVMFHHVVVTQDAGEHRTRRPETADRDLPPRLDRRHVLSGVLGLGVVGLGGGLGLAAFGPRRPRSSTWQAGSYLVTVDGNRLTPADIPDGGVVTVWPEGFAGTERAAVMLIRLRDAPLPPTRLDDAVVEDRLVAYSRLCTHAGCAVALYRDLDQALFCPCHQATFDVRRAATPMSGPASVPLPQLPIGLAGNGYLVATGDLTAPPGPAGGTV